jgi:hypothetical protein
MARVRIDGVREMQAAAVALRGIDKDVRRDITKGVRQVVAPVWKQAVEKNATRRMDRAVLTPGTRVNVGMRPTLVAASSRKALSGGLVPTESWRAYEFGGKRGTTKKYRGRRGGKAFPVTRHTKRQLPEFKKGGRVLYPAVADIAPRVFALWSQTVVRLVYKAFE